MNQTGQCISCIDSNSTYWCSMSPDDTSGICCDINESVQDCIGLIANPNDYICSNTEGVPKNATYLLCPQDTTGECQDIDEVIVNSSSTYNRSDTGILDENILCKFKISVNSSMPYPSAGTLLADGSRLVGQISRSIVNMHVDYNYRGIIKTYVYNQETKSFIYIDENGGKYDSHASATINKTTPFYAYFLGTDYYACAGLDFNTTDDVASQGLQIQQDDSSNGGVIDGPDSQVVLTSQSTAGAGDLSKSDIVSIVLGLVVLGLTVLLLLVLYALYKMRKRYLDLKNNPPKSEVYLEKKPTTDKLNVDIDQIFLEQQNRENQNVVVAVPSNIAPANGEPVNVESVKVDPMNFNPVCIEPAINGPIIVADEEVKVNIHPSYPVIQN